MRFWKSDFQWWLLKKVLRWYVRDHLSLWAISDEWRAIYIGVNCGAVNGSDERHLAYIEREDA